MLLAVIAEIAYARPDELADPERRARWLEILSSDENARMLRLRSEPKRDLFLAAHALLRLSLSRCAGVDPAAWQFGAGEDGRPRVRAPRTDLAVTLSHTRDLACCAVTTGEDVGIDVEDISRSRPAGLAERYLSPRELRDLRRLPESDQPAGFFEYWTLKEAYVKARGKGLALPFDSFSFYRDGDEWRLDLDVDGAKEDASGWSFRSWRVGGRHQVALALSTASAQTSIDVKNLSGDVARSR